MANIVVFRLISSLPNVLFMLYSLYLWTAVYLPATVTTIFSFSTLVILTGVGFRYCLPAVQCRHLALLLYARMMTAPLWHAMSHF
jgi:hypothetical protein